MNTNGIHNTKSQAPPSPGPVNHLLTLTDNDKIEIISHHFRQIMQTLGLNLNDSSLADTPRRVAKMYVKEVFQGLNPMARPSAKMFENNYGYGEMLVEKDITFFSCCEHHFVPFFGKAHVAYISSGKIIGLSKLNRIVQYLARKPQVQERLTAEIAEELKVVLETSDVAVVLEARHLCVASRGVRDVNSTTTTAIYSGKFLAGDSKSEFLQYIRSC